MNSRELASRYEQESRAFYRAVESFTNMMAQRARAGYPDNQDYGALLEVEEKLRSLKRTREDLQASLGEQVMVPPKNGGRYAPLHIPRA